jgi:flagellar motor component MotA
MMLIRKTVVASALVGVVMMAILMGSPLALFFDLPSFLIVCGGTVAGMFISHSGADVRQVLTVYFGPSVMSEQDGRRGALLFGSLGNMAYGVGLVGTLIGLVQMLQNLEDPAAIGPAMAVALLTLFYGVFLSEVVFRSAAFDCLKRSGLHAENDTEHLSGRSWSSIAALFVLLFVFMVMLLAMAATF